MSRNDNLNCKVRWLLFGACAVGCAEQLPPGVVTRDSSGVEVVLNQHPVWPASTGWAVDPVPAMDIGAEDGPAEGHLYQVRDAIRLGEAIVVLNGVTDDLRVFGRGGRYDRTIGRQGRGPGEFLNFGFVRVLHDDSLLTWDFGNNRVSVFDRAGHLARSLYLQTDDSFGANLVPTILLTDGSLLTRAKRHLVELPAEAGRVTDSVTVAIHTPEGMIDTILGVFPSGARMRVPRGDWITTMDAPFPAYLRAVRWKQGFCLGSGKTYELHCRQESHGPVTHIVRVTEAPRPVTPEQAKEYVEREVATRTGANGRYFRMIADDLIFPETFPMFGELQVDPTDHLWVEDYPMPGESGATWRVFSPEGVWLGRVTMPRDLRVFRIYEDIVLGVWRDSLDVEHVRTHRIRR